MKVKVRKGHLSRRRVKELVAVSKFWRDCNVRPCFCFVFFSIFPYHSCLMCSQLMLSRFWSCWDQVIDIIGSGCVEGRGCRREGGGGVCHKTDRGDVLVKSISGWFQFLSFRLLSHRELRDFLVFILFSFFSQCIRTEAHDSEQSALCIHVWCLVWERLQQFWEMLPQLSWKTCGGGSPTVWTMTCSSPTVPGNMLYYGTRTMRCVPERERERDRERESYTMQMVLNVSWHKRKKDKKRVMRRGERKREREYFIMQTVLIISWHKRERDKDRIRRKGEKESFTQWKLFKSSCGTRERKIGTEKGRGWEREVREKVSRFLEWVSQNFYTMQAVLIYLQASEGERESDRKLGG